LARLLDFDTPTNPARVMDNADWIGPVSYLDFLLDVGKHFSVNMMIAKESVRGRMEDRESGISYTEFSYMLLQAFDFMHLRAEHQCELQIGGTDQWGNITAGIDLCRKKLNRPAFGLTLPLVTKSDGTKFGKTESGAIWLDPARTSVYKFYQFWIRTDDRDVVRHLKFFTFMSREDIDDLAAQLTARPEARVAHKALAKAMTEMIHGASETAEVIRASEILFGGGLEGIAERTFEEIVGEVPTRDVDGGVFDGEGWPLLQALVHAGLCASKGQARKDLQGGGIYLNNERQTDALRALGRDGLLFGKYLLLRKGRRNYTVLRAGG